MSLVFLFVSDRFLSELFKEITHESAMHSVLLLFFGLALSGFHDPGHVNLEVFKQEHVTSSDILSLFLSNLFPDHVDPLFSLLHIRNELSM